jgi:hypothetical protein
MTADSNMSPLHYLILINCEHILPLLCGQVFTPPAVIEEMRAPNTPEVVRRWVDSPPEWLQIVEPANIKTSRDLGKAREEPARKPPSPSLAKSGPMLCSSTTRRASKKPRREA